MNCTNPWLFKDKEGNIIELPCRRCMACRIRLAGEWTIRLSHELNYHKESMFLTLTYGEEYLPEDNSLNKRDVQLFFKRFRKAIYPRRIKYLYTGEYGEGNNRPHYHAIVFGWRPPLNDLYYVGQKGRRKYYASKFIDKIWSKGFNLIGVVEHKSIGYVCRYCTKKLFGPKGDEVYGDSVRPFMHASKGLGLIYALENKERIEENGLIFRGKRVGIPSYYFKKLGLSKEAVVEGVTKAVKQRNDRWYSGLDLVEINHILKSSRRQREKDLKARESLK